jgi:NIMA (never in mitosis gene a)-related kinase
MIIPNQNIMILESEVTNDNLKSSHQTYQKVKSIGKGSYGEVFLIKSLQTQKEYALKETLITKNKEMFLYFSMNEINILSKLNNPYIISLKCAFKTQIDEETEKLNIIMEYVDNGDLNQLITKYKDDEKFFEEKRLLNWLFQLCLSLLYLKENEIIHRDIKPSNIFLLKDDTIKLADFGISKKVSKEDSMFIGTPVYTSPEIISKKDYSYKADIWSLGVTFLQLIFLRLPFLGEDHETIYNNIIHKILNPKILNKDKTGYNEDIIKNYSKEFIDLIDKMVSVNQDDRPSVKEILNKAIIKTRMELYLKENNFDENEIIKTKDEIKQKIKEISKNIEKNEKDLIEKERKQSIKTIKNLMEKREFLKKLIIINNSFKTDFKSIEV